MAAPAESEPIPGSGEVFRDFGHDDAEEPQLESQLTAKIIGMLDAQGLTVRKAEEATGIAAADLSRIRTAKLQRFTVDRLSTILNRPGQAVDMVVTTRPEPEPVRQLDALTTAATQAFMKRLVGLYAVKEAILFGSRARQTHRDDSDADLAVIFAGKPGDRSGTARALAGIAFDILMDTGVLVAALPLWEGELEHPDLFSNPALVRNIRRDGLRL